MFSRLLLTLPRVGSWLTRHRPSGTRPLSSSVAQEVVPPSSSDDNSSNNNRPRRTRAASTRKKSSPKKLPSQGTLSSPVDPLTVKPYPLMLPSLQQQSEATRKSVEEQTQSSVETLRSTVSNLVVLAIKFAKHLYGGSRKLYHNYQKRKELLQEEKEGRTLTFSDGKLVQVTKQDLRRLIPFGLTILILPEAIPFLVWLVPGFLPTTFESDAERGKNRRTMEDKLTVTWLQVLQQSLNEFPEEVGNHQPTLQVLRHAATLEEAVSQARKLAQIQNIPLADCYGSFLPAMCQSASIMSLGFDWMSRRRLQKRFGHLEEGDRLIRLHGVDSLNDEQVDAECIQRGMFLECPQQRRVDLSFWLKTTESEGTEAMPLLLLLTGLQTACRNKSVRFLGGLLD